jgi:hypothetical protein
MSSANRYGGRLMIPSVSGTSNSIVLGSQHSPVLATFPLPDNIQVWKHRYKQAMQDMKPLVVGMGLYLHIRRDKQEMLEIIQKVGPARYDAEVNLAFDALS